MSQLDLRIAISEVRLVRTTSTGFVCEFLPEHEAVDPIQIELPSSVAAQLVESLKAELASANYVDAHRRTAKPKAAAKRSSDDLDRLTDTERAWLTGASGRGEAPGRVSDGEADDTKEEEQFAQAA